MSGDSQEFVIRNVRCLIKLRAVKEFVGRIVMCLIELRAVKEFVMMMQSLRLSGVPQGVCNKNCKLSD